MKYINNLCKLDMFVTLGGPVLVFVIMISADFSGGDGAGGLSFLLLAGYIIAIYTVVSTVLKVVLVTMVPKLTYMVLFLLIPILYGIFEYTNIIVFNNRGTFFDVGWVVIIIHLATTISLYVQTKRS